MKKIEVLGPGCNNCQRLEANAREAVALTGVDAEIVKVTDYPDRRLRCDEHPRPGDRRSGRECGTSPGGQADRRMAHPPGQT